VQQLTRLQLTQRRAVPLRQLSLMCRARRIAQLAERDANIVYVCLSDRVGPSVRHALMLCFKSSAVAEMGDRLATIDVGRKLGAVPLFRGSWVPI